MAKKDDVKLDIRAYYESNNLAYSAAYAYAKAKNYDVSQKTIEYWGKKEEWIKGKYRSLVEAIDAVVPKINREASDSIAKDIKDNLPPEIPKSAEDYFTNRVTDEIMMLSLNKRFLAKEMVENLQSSKTISSVSGSIGVKKTYHDMLVSTYQTIHGKQTNIGILNPSAKDNAELESMSTEELLEIIENE